MRNISGMLAILAFVIFIVSFLPWTTASGDEQVVHNSKTITVAQQFEQGRMLFRNKGCVTCHRHDGIDGPFEGGSIGPNLTDYRPDPGFVHSWLRNPGAIRPETRMPNLNLSEAEIAALIAFLDGEPHDACPTTRSPNQPFLPPTPHSQDSPIDDHFWHGSNDLWTLLRTDGEWSDLPANEQGYGQKVVWWNEGYDWRKEPLPELVVTGRRLDDVAPPLIASAATNGYQPDFESFMLVGVEIPTAGCWEITGHYAEHQLTFVVWVTP